MVFLSERSANLMIFFQFQKALAEQRRAEMRAQILQNRKAAKNQEDPAIGASEEC